MVHHSTCVVCRGPCVIGCLTCRSCYDNGHRPAEGKDDGELFRLKAINSIVHESSILLRRSRRGDGLPIGWQDLALTRIEDVPQDSRWYFVDVKPNQNQAHYAKVKLKRVGFDATQKRCGFEYRIFIRKVS